MAELASFVLAIAGGADVIARTSFAFARLIREWKDAPAQIARTEAGIQAIRQKCARILYLLLL
jgi:hypothetical protein